MGLTKRCFSSVAALQRLSPQVLRDLLALFPEYMVERDLSLPVTVSDDKLDYGRIRDALMADEVPADLDDVLYLASRMGTASVAECGRFIGCSGRIGRGAAPDVSRSGREIGATGRTACGTGIIQTSRGDGSGLGFGQV